MIFINQQKEYSKKLNKYVTIFDYIDKILIVLSATTGGISIISFTTAIFDYIDKILIVLSATTGGISIISFTTATGAPVGIVSASFILIFSITTGIIKKLLDITIKEKKKHDHLLMLAKSKFNSIETIISQVLGDLDISHEEFIMILKEKDRYKKMKYNLINENGDEKQEIVKIISIK